MSGLVPGALSGSPSRDAHDSPVGRYPHPCSQAEKLRHRLKSRPLMVELRAVAQATVSFSCVVSKSGKGHSKDENVAETE